MVRDGRAASALSKSTNSTPEAMRENTLKLTPSAQTVAPGIALRRSISIPAFLNDDSLAAEERPGLGVV